MTVNYIFKINDAKTKDIIRNLPSMKNFCDDLSCVNFKSAELHNGGERRISLTVSLDREMDPDFFRHLTNEIGEKTGIKVECSFEFGGEIAPGSMFKPYWAFFISSVKQMKSWLNHVKPEYSRGKLILICQGEIIYRKLSAPGAMKKMKKEIKSFFGKIPEIELAESVKTDVNAPPELIRTVLSGENKENSESYILKEKQINGKITPIENIAEEGRYVVEGNIFFSGDYKREIKNTRGKDDANPYVLVFYITDNRDTIKLFTFVKNGDSLVDILPSLSRVRAVIEVKYDDREGELTGKVKKMCRVSDIKNIDEEKEKRVEMHAHTQMSAMDAIMGIKEYIKTAAEWGHKAVAVTDHGVVHSFPEAYKEAKARGIKLIPGLEGYLVDSIENYKKTKPFHVVLLAKNKKGLKNLYKIVSHSHLKYFYKKPRIPREELENHREGLVIGSGCCQGEMFKAVLEGKEKEEIEKIVSFYDYLEIQPNENNKFLIREGVLKSESELNDINRKIYEYGKKAGKPVLATGDVHFLRKEDRIYRDVLLFAQGYDKLGEEGSASLHFRTTRDMLSEFGYLGSRRAKEVVVENPGIIERNIESDISPVPEKLHPPYIKNSDEEIKRITYENAFEIYGKNLPGIVEKRIIKELDAIIGNKYSVLYLIAKKMVDKSLEDGYIVGSRGSVGSSFVAFLCGISEVNPLPAHYFCKHCKNLVFTQTGLVGVDLPEKNCGKCGASFIKDGYNIPFETFMGFTGEKVPDIDLNFSGEYQDRIHDFVRELFGDDKVYRAGTIVTIQELAVKKDFIGKYTERTNQRVKNAERERLARGCAGVKRSTGQHAGGLMLVPEDKEIYDFTPIQKNPKESAITTHFDYRWVHDALVKIDALGHDLPTSLRRICSELNINPEDIPLNDKKTMKIFSDIRALGVEPGNYEHPVGTLGVPEFGTRFTRDMLSTTKPSTFSELIYISGLSHGTNVWKRNAEDIIKSKTAALKDVISVRDDIMNYLISRGLPADRAFDITEKVRKGKGLTTENEQLMRKKKVPGWYIESCKKIKYMFPKAHAVAYAIMSFKLAYFKVHYPLYFYADYFNRELDGFDHEFVFLTLKDIRIKIKECKMKRFLEKKEKDRLKVLEVLMEMKERRIEFSDIDIYKSDSVLFKALEGKIQVPLIIVPELGEKVAVNIKNEREKEKFSSLEDMSRRTKINKNVVKFLAENGIAGELPASDQTVLF